MPRRERVSHEKISASVADVETLSRILVDFVTTMVFCAPRNVYKKIMGSLFLSGLTCFNCISRIMFH